MQLAVSTSAMLAIQNLATLAALRGAPRQASLAKFYKSPWALACAEIGISEQADACRSRSAIPPTPPGRPPTMRSRHVA